MADHAHDAHGSHDTTPKREIFWLILITLVIATAGLGALIGPDDDDEEATETTEQIAEHDEVEGELD
jgi:Na+-transporting methylmalonyl-CoA/oxaloacetate decarboxylase gamma subunit